MKTDEIKPVATITAKKIDDYTIEITETKEPPVTKNNYDIKFLQKQRKDIEVQRDVFVALRDEEIADVDAKLKLCEEHLIIAKEDPLIEEPDVKPIINPIDIKH
jgi:hypothetical protein